MRTLNEIYVAIDNAAVEQETELYLINKVTHKTRKTNFVFPLKFCPHLSELSICAGSRLDVIHDVNVNITEDHTVSVAGCSRDIIHCKRTHKNIFECSKALNKGAELLPAS